MSEKKQDQNSSNEQKTTLSVGKTLSLKGLDPKALERSATSGPLIEHKRRRVITPQAVTRSAPVTPVAAVAQQNPVVQSAQNTISAANAVTGTSGQQGNNRKRSGRNDRNSGQNNNNVQATVKSGLTLSKAELDARQRALSLAHQQFEQDEQRRKQQEIDKKLQIEQQKQNEALASESVQIDNTPKENTPKDVVISGKLQTTSIEEVQPRRIIDKSKRPAGPKILGTLDPSQYMGKSRSHLGSNNTNSNTNNTQPRTDNNRNDNNRVRNNNERPDFRRNNNTAFDGRSRPEGQNRDNTQRPAYTPSAGGASGGASGNYQNRSSNTDRPAGTGGYQGNRPASDRNSGDNNRTPYPKRPATAGTSYNADNGFSNQRTDFLTPAADTLAKAPTRLGGAKNKTKTRSDEAYSDANAAKRPVIGGDKERKLTVFNADSTDEVRNRSVASYRRKLDKQKKSMMQQDDKQKVYREVIIPESITVQDLANRMSERSADLVKELMKLGIMATLNKVLDADTAEIIVETLGHTPRRVCESDVENTTQIYEDSADTLKYRAPVVTIMGHVDHGKTSLLDALRKTNVVSGEAGGITQHIGAYQVRLHDDKRITFIDTPGHAAFSEMRARGAKVTDIVILVVAADDGVMPQTIEAIKHAKAAEVPIIVAINKIDKHNADPQRIRTELLQHEIVVESMGGDVIDVEVSAKQRLNLEGLLESILLQAEVLELTANPDRFGEGVVIEAQLDKGRGPVATLLMQHGNIKIGDIVVAGAAWGRVRALVNDLGERVQNAGPSVPVEILGLGGVPLAGDVFMVVESENRAREISEYRERKLKERSSLATAKTLDSLMNQIKESEMKSMPVVLKGDVQGSVEAICVALAKLGNEEVKVQVVHSGVGGVTESDVNLAETSGGIVVGFNVRANKQARDLSEERKIEIRYYSIIYNLIDDVKAALSGMLSPEMRENFLGNAEILEVFDITKVGKVAGCRIREGMAKRSAKVRLIRDNVVVHEGVLSTLRRFKDEVKEVQNGYECGMAFEGYNDIRVGDTIEIFEIQEIQRHLA